MKAEFCLERLEISLKISSIMKKIHYPNRDFVFSQLICIIWDNFNKKKEKVEDEYRLKLIELWQLDRWLKIMKKGTTSPIE